MTSVLIVSLRWMKLSKFIWIICFDHEIWILMANWFNHCFFSALRWCLRKKKIGKGQVLRADDQPQRHGLFLYETNLCISKVKALIYTRVKNRWGRWQPHEHKLPDALTVTLTVCFKEKHKLSKTLNKAYQTPVINSGIK